jgi:hypothetical protein
VITRALLAFALSSPWALGACGDDPPARSQARRERALAKSPMPAMPRPNAVSPYEADGRTLAPSSDLVLGVVVPRTAKVVSKQPEIARVTIERVPYASVERFYQRYLLTGRVERSRLGMRFMDATPKAPGNERARVDVHLQSSPRGTIIAIFDESPRGVKAPQGEAAVREARGGLPGPVDFTKRIPGVTE